MTQTSKARKKRRGSVNLDGKGVDLPGAKLVFQITRFRQAGYAQDWKLHTAVAAFTVLKDAADWIGKQEFPNDYRIDRKHLVEINGKWYPVNVYPYRVTIDNPEAPDIVLDSTGMRASKRQPHKQNNPMTED
jgi:hypothetical protein